MATPHTLNMTTPDMTRVCLHGDLQRFGHHFSLSVKTGAEAIYALTMQIPSFRQKMNNGWYQIRVVSLDVNETSLSAHLHESLPDGAIIHIVPRMARARSGGLFQVVPGTVAITVSFFTAKASLAAWGIALSIGAISASSVLFSMGAAMTLGGVAQMLTPQTKIPSFRQIDNGKQNAYFSSLDDMMAQGNALSVLCGEMLVGSHTISQEISARDEDGGGQAVTIGR